MPPTTSSPTEGLLREQHCSPVAKGAAPLSAAAVKELLPQVSAWAVTENDDAIERLFRFADFHHTMAFVNAVAWVAHQQDHHPDLEVGYNRCRVRYSTHAAGGLTRNDFICAARIDALLNAS